MNKLAEDLAKVLKDNGIGTDEPGDGDEGDSGKEEDNKGEEEAKGANAKVVSDLAEGIASKIVEAVAKKTGMAEGDKKALLEDARSKVFTRWGGIKEISYPSDLTSLTKDEKIVNFFKAMVYSHSDPTSERVLRALVEGTDSEGGYLVPEELRAEVFRLLPEMAVMRRIARVIPMQTDTLKLNTLTARPTAYWTAEYASKATTSAEFGQVTLTPHDLVCLLPVSEQLLADANISMVNFIVELFTEAIALGEDKAFFTGSGSGQPRGISIESISSRSANGSLDLDDVIALMDMVTQRVSQSPGAAFVAHRAVKSILRGVKDQNGLYIWRDGGANNGATGRLPDTLFGYPFYEQNDLSSHELYFGDWRNYIIGDRQAISVRTTTEGGEAWRRNAIEIKAVERVDGRAVLLGAFAKLTGI